MPEPRLRFDGMEPALRPSLLSAVRSFGFSQMTPVQAATMPLFLRHKDVCVEAVTGSGKTLAFLLPTFQILLRRERRHRPNQVGALVLSPTRELARQTLQVAEKLLAVVNADEPAAQSRPFSAVLLTGGSDVAAELATLAAEGADIIIGTPGRTLDVLERSAALELLDLRELEVLVLDEADTLLDMGFSAAVTEILGRLPRQRRTGLFSATQTREVKALARAGLRNPAGVRVAVQSAAAGDGAGVLERSVPTSLSSFYCTLRADAKLDFLVDFLCDRREEKVLVFMLTCAAVDFFTKALGTLQRTREVHVEGLHGRMPQKKRSLVYEAFGRPKPAVLICTDVAARGLDVPDVDWIVQFDPPQDPSFFIHRVGRAARAGRRGSALTLMLEEEEAYVNFLELKGVPMQATTAAELGTFGREETSAARTGGSDDTSRGKVAASEGATPDKPWSSSLDELREAQKRDRDLLELGTRAFISYLRAYKEHQCSYIFQLSALPLGDVARSFALLKLPNIGELRKASLEGFAPDETVDTSSIPYQDAQREKARQKRLGLMRQEKERREVYNAAHPKRRGKKERSAAKELPKRKRKGRNQRLVEEWDELAREERLYKRLRKGKLSETEYETLLKQDEDELRAQESDAEDEKAQDKTRGKSGGSRKEWKASLHGQRYSSAQRRGKRTKR